jgi:Hydrogenase/urease nickel incorporation, metallochaperone, hypA
MRHASLSTQSVQEAAVVPRERRLHELAITESLVDCVCENVGEASVIRVVVEIGKQSAVMPDAVRGCFEFCSKGTALEGAKLEIVEPPGDELRIREVEVT